MSETNEILEEAIRIIEQQIEAIKEKDFDRFSSLMTPKIRDLLNDDVFEQAISLFQRVPLDLDAIDKGNSKIVSDSEIKLKMVNGRTLCNLIKLEDSWLVDDIYWKLN